jgi:hypothetical protein
MAPLEVDISFTILPLASQFTSPAVDRVHERADSALFRSAHGTNTRGGVVGENSQGSTSPGKHLTYVRLEFFVEGTKHKML